MLRALASELSVDFVAIDDVTQAMSARRVLAAASTGIIRISR